MPEIDPQFENPRVSDGSGDARLSEAMQRLAASSRQGAPAEIGAGLATAFRRHHTRRRRIRYASMAGLVACFLAIAGLFFLQTPRRPQPAQSATKNTPQNAPQNVNQAHVEPAQTPRTQEATQTASMPAERPKAALKLLHPQVNTTNATATKVAYSREFVALPGYDPEVPAEDLHIVRVQLPTSTLWQMGAPINPAGRERRVLADFVIGQDGTPYGVRLVHTAIF